MQNSLFGPEVNFVQSLSENSGKSSFWTIRKIADEGH